MMQPFILASSSKYRQAQFAALGIPVSAVAPDIDESAVENEPAPELAARLATAKAAKVAKINPHAVVIGSDQVASVEHQGKQRLLGKPGDHASAVNQLLMCQGKSVTFYTALCVSYQQHIETRTDITQVTFRNLTEQQINRYLLAERPYDCAGSFKAEGKGILLFDRITSRDPNGLIGLPVMLLQDMLLKLDTDLLDIATQSVQVG